MRTTFLRAAIVAASALTVLAPAYAVHNDRRFERIGTERGLSELTVRAIVQDGRGFLWFGTQEGLNRFDGRSTVVYRRDPGNPASLGSNRISALFVDSRGTLWVGTRGGGLSRFDALRERFETFRHHPKNPQSISQDDIAAIAEDRKGRLWVATMRGGVNRIDDVSSVRFTRIQHDDAEPASLADNRTRALLVDRDGVVWIATMSGIDRMASENPPRFDHHRHDPARPDSISDDEVWSIAQDRDGIVWAGTWGGGLSRLEDGRFTNFLPGENDPTSLSDNRVMRIVEDRDGTLWIATLDGLNELLATEKRAAKPRFIRHEHDPNWSSSLSSNDTLPVYEDRRGDLWIGTANGVNRLDRRQRAFVAFGHDAADPDSLGAADGVRSILEDRRGVLWLGTSKGLDRIVPSADRFTPPAVTHFRENDGSGFTGEYVSELFEDRRGTIWIATVGGGVLTMAADEATKPKPRFVQYTNDPAKGTPLASNAALSLFEDRSGTVWVGTYRGLHRANADGTFTAFRHDRGDPTTLSADTIEAIGEDAAGNLWVGTYYGLNRFDRATGKAERFLPNPQSAGSSLSHEYIHDLHVARDGAVWAGTWGGGASRLDPATRTFKTYGVRERMPSETVHAIHEASDGALWFATTRGLGRLDPRSGVISAVGARDGLHTDEIATLTTSRAGQLLVGGAAGVTAFDPRKLVLDAEPPPVVLTGLRVLNVPVAIGESFLSQSISWTERITLRHRDYLFAFDFAALGYDRPEKMRYRYRLDGFDPGWIAADAGERKAVYSNVPPGRYTFRVAAANADGAWNEKGASIGVTVLPPWWMTWWARAIAVLLLIAIAVSWPLVRLARSRRLNALLEAKVTERTSQLEEANRRLDEASRTDPLTKLPNRRHFMEKVEEQLAAQRRSGRPFAVAIADIDNFKSVNDTHGHDTGDRVLREVADVLRATLRETDHVARWGGEEFIVLLPDTDGEAAVSVTEKIRAAIANREFHVGEQRLPLSATFGVSSVTSGVTFEQMSARADAALYEGKRSGKNKVVLAA